MLIHCKAIPGGHAMSEVTHMLVYKKMAEIHWVNRIIISFIAMLRGLICKNANPIYLSRLNPEGLDVMMIRCPQ